MSDEIKIEPSRDILQALQQRSRRRFWNRLLPKACLVVISAGLLNFLLFAVGAIYFGGDAVNGKVEDGRYYFWGNYNGQKQYHQVSKPLFEYSKWHTYSVMATWPLVMLAGFISNRIKHPED